MIQWQYMSDEVYSDIQLERIVKDSFGVDIEIAKVIIRDVEVGRMSTATIFLTKKKQLLVYVSGHSKLLLSDVKKIIARMGLKAELYFPPKNQPNYFNEIGREKFRGVFPGRGQITDEDILFYK